MAKTNVLMLQTAIFRWKNSAYQTQGWWTNIQLHTDGHTSNNTIFYTPSYDPNALPKYAKMTVEAKYKKNSGSKFNIKLKKNAIVNILENKDREIGTNWMTLSRTVTAMRSGFLLCHRIICNPIPKICLWKWKKN